MLKKLREIQLIENSDCPEMAISGLEEGLKHALPNSLAFVLTDATAKDFNKYRSVLNTMQSKQITATFLLTGDCGNGDGDGHVVYRKLARFTNGQEFDMKSEGVKEVILAIQTLLDDEFTTLKYLIKDTAGTSIEEFPVDFTITEIQISLSGSNPSMVIKNPLGEIVTGRVTSMANLIIVKILNPMPGKWTVEVKSSSKHSIRFGAISSLKIEYGFSIDTPVNPSLNRGAGLLNRGAGLPNIMTIFVPDSSAIDLTEVDLDIQELDIY